MAIVGSFFLCSPFLWRMGVLATSQLAALLVAGSLVAMIGFWDDLAGVPSHWRLLVHFVAAGWGVACLGGMPPLPLSGKLVYLGWPGHAGAVLYLVWLLNLYNFMDGIDGIASIEAITVCLGGVLLYAMFVPGGGQQWAVPLLLLAAVLGFLFWNFPRAKIFLGDSGSGFLGMTLGLMSLQAASRQPKLFWGWVILLGVFVVDATVTLIRRVLRREKFFMAHRSHAYQRAARMARGHKAVSLAVGGVNLFWLLPLALLVGGGVLDGVVGVAGAYLPLVGGALFFKAGAREA